VYILPAYILPIQLVLLLLRHASNFVCQYVEKQSIWFISRCYGVTNYRRDHSGPQQRQILAPRTTSDHF